MKNYINFIIETISSFYNWEYISKDSFIDMLIVLCIISFFIFSGLIYRKEKNHINDVSITVKKLSSIFYGSILGLLSVIAFSILPGVLITLILISPIIIAFYYYLNWIGSVESFTFDISFNSKKKKIDQLSREYYNLTKMKSNNNYTREEINRKMEIENQLNNLMS